MRICLDSGVAFKWVVTEPQSPKALQLLAEIQQGIHETIAPDTFPLEIANSLAKGERQGRVVDAIGMWVGVMLDCPVLHHHRSHLSRALEIASATRIVVYDALYVALSEQEGCKFITADQRLLNSAQKSVPFIVPLASFP